MLNVANAYEIARGHQFPLTGKNSPDCCVTQFHLKMYPQKRLTKMYVQIKCKTTDISQKSVSSLSYVPDDVLCLKYIL